MVASLQPDIIVNLGDWWEFNSLSWFDKGKPQFYQTNYKKDVEVGRTLLDAFFEPIYRRKQKLPKRYFFLGNHEYRIEKARNTPGQVANMAQLLSLDDLELNNWFSDVVPYNGSHPGIIDIEGILFSHYFKDRAQQHTAHQILSEQHQSICQGHHHQLDYKVHSTLDGRHLHGLCVPMLKKRFHDWAGNMSNRWQGGFCVLDNVSNGDYALSVIREEDL